MFVPKVLHVTLVHSLIKTPRKIRNIANGMGLKKKYDSFVFVSTPKMNKFFNKISHLIQLVPIKLLPYEVSIPSDVPNWVKKSNFIDKDTLKNDIRFQDTQLVNCYGYCDTYKTNKCQQLYTHVYNEYKNNVDSYK